MLIAGHSEVRGGEGRHVQAGTAREDACLDAVNADNDGFPSELPVPGNFELKDELVDPAEDFVGPSPAAGQFTASPPGRNGSEQPHLVARTKLGALQVVPPALAFDGSMEVAADIGVDAGNAVLVHPEVVRKGFWVGGRRGWGRAKQYIQGGGRRAAVEGLEGGEAGRSRGADVHCVHGMGQDVFPIGALRFKKGTEDGAQSAMSPLNGVTFRIVRRGGGASDAVCRHGVRELPRRELGTIIAVNAEGIVIPAEDLLLQQATSLLGGGRAHGEGLQPLGEGVLHRQDVETAVLGAVEGAHEIDVKALEGHTSHRTAQKTPLVLPLSDLLLARNTLRDGLCNFLPRMREVCCL